ncbi:hypothetical protein DYD21_03575 [Rhodohalobacter sp. SW132]|uniref:hypothetical protein n=1 Tax=Rhodohalobacter sp. SW132 TaxID=2293433 RepID=UPI000E22271A|nr:hypothetical protein [Rhodohalobacter sp. SW132]REL39049.1 hypothetical protein DYD21_03575 [Rhodohalobacter sp. SW132]
MKNSQPFYNYWSAASVFFVSVAIIALQLMIMRAMSVTHYYHFSYLIISTALLGFGASGTFLALFYDKLKSRFELWNLLFFLGFTLSIPITYWITQSLPLDTQYLLHSGEQIMLLVTYNVLLFIPFFFGGTIVGFMISYFKREVPELYAANLIGSGAGGVFAIGLMFLVPAFKLPVMITPVAFLSMVCFWLSVRFEPGKNHARDVIIGSIGAVATLAAVLIAPPHSIDQYKALAHFQQLERQGDAEQIQERFGPRGQINVYASPTFHHTLFAGAMATTTPPDQLALMLDGQLTGAIFSIDDPEEAAIMDFTPQSLPYRLLDDPHVLLLGETGGVNVWMAKRMGAERITVVQNNPQLVDLIENDLADLGGSIYRDEQVEVIAQNPRLFLEQTDQTFDLIQLVQGEVLTTGSGGLQGLSEDYLLTVESIARARDRLSPDGMISITREIQSPPRDNLKIFSIFRDAVLNFSSDRPEEHLFISRNYLAANTLLTKSPITPERVERFVEEARQLQLDREFYPGIVSEEIDQINIIDGPDETNYSYIHHAINRILFDDADAFYDDWAYQVRSSTDDSPYFQDFFKWSSLDRFLETYGDQWFQRLELGYVILVITFLQLSIVGFLLIIAPLLFRRKYYKGTNNKLPTLIYFFCIGTGFMFIEMTFIQTFTLFLGDPIFSVAAILSSILVFSGIGSGVQKKLGMEPGRRMRIAAGSIIGITLIYLLTVDPLLQLFIGAGTAWRFLITILLLMPVSFFFGWMFPSGVHILEKSDGSLIPWAWGVDGFASVAAAPLAIILSMSFGFTNVILLGLLFYGMAGVTSYFWKLES